MTLLSRTMSVLATVLALAPVAQAATGGIHSFSSSATEVQVGDTVDFSVSFSLSTSSWSGGGSNPNEPTPEEGYQQWNVNWYSWEYETLSNVSLQAGGQNIVDSPSLAAGESYANTWMFSLTFDNAGVFDISPSGGWQSTVSHGYSNENASRTCTADADGGGALSCDSWYWQYSDSDDWYSTEGSLQGPSIRITVAAVPEPGTWALMLAGVGLLARLGRRLAL